MAVEQIQVDGELLESDRAASGRIVVGGDDTIREVIDGE